MPNGFHSSYLALLFALFSCIPSINCQVSVQFQILPQGKQNVTVDPNAFSEYIQQSGSAVPIASISQTVDTMLNALECPRGTFSITSPDGSQICQKCPAGTASAVTSASSIAACFPCSAGSFSLEQASTCTDCATNTFSPLQAAPSISSCLRCPKNTTSPNHSGSVEMCVCDPGLFLSDNLMSSYPYDATSIALSLVSILSINVPHVSC